MNLYRRAHWSHLKLPGITVSVEPRSEPKAAVFMVKSVIDDGRGRRSLVLADPEFLILHTEYLMEPKRFIPPGLGKLDLIYTGRYAMHVPYLHKALADFYKTSKVEAVVPDVLEPGDFLVFRQGGRRQGFHMLEALRVMTEKKCRKHAL